MFMFMSCGAAGGRTHDEGAARREQIDERACGGGERNERGQRLVRREAAAAAAASGVEERRGSAQGDFTSLPVVDLGPLVMYTAGLRGLEEDVLQCCREIDAACRRCGFFYVKNHGVPEPLVSGVRELSKEFFRRPRKDKERLRLGASTSFRGYQALGDNVTRFDGGFSRDWHEAIGEAHTRTRAHAHSHSDALTHARMCNGKRARSLVRVPSRLFFVRA